MCEWWFAMDSVGSVVIGRRWLVQRRSEVQSSGSAGGRGVDGVDGLEGKRKLLGGGGLLDALRYFGGRSAERSLGPSTARCLVELSRLRDR